MKRQLSIVQSLTGYEQCFSGVTCPTGVNLYIDSPQHSWSFENDLVFTNHDSNEALALRIENSRIRRSYFCEKIAAGLGPRDAVRETRIKNNEYFDHQSFRACLTCILQPKKSSWSASCQRALNE